MKRLTISGSRGPLAIVIKNQHGVFLKHVEDRVANDVNRWIKRGFAGYDMVKYQHYRVRPTDENFLEEIAKLAAFYHFDTLIEETNECDN
jgi:hypothetical protein